MSMLLMKVLQSVYKSIEYLVVFVVVAVGKFYAIAQN